MSLSFFGYEFCSFQEKRGRLEKEKEKLNKAADKLEATKKDLADTAQE